MFAVQKNKERKTDRILVLKVKEGERPISSTGLVDTRLFSGDNKLHAVQDLSNRLWSLKYEMGGVPEPLKEKFTTFDRALHSAKTYFNKRNVEIVEVID